MKRTDARAGRNDSRKNFRWEIETFEQVVGPGAFGGMEKLSRGGIRKFGNSYGTETPVEKVGHHEQAIGGGEKSIAVSHFASGLYFVKIIQDGRVAVSKFVKR